MCGDVTLKTSNSPSVIRYSTGEKRLNYDCQTNFIEVRLRE